MRAAPIEGVTIPESGARAWLASRSDGRRLHAGVDLGREAGELVRAPEAGTVVVVAEASYGGDTPRRSSPAGWAGYGPHVVVLDGASGAWHVLGHLSAPRVERGEVVELGQVVGEVAARGRHLHWEVRTRQRPPWQWAAVEVSADPAAWLASGELDVWQPSRGCPPSPEQSVRTPRACRPDATLPAAEEGEEPPEARTPSPTRRRPVRRPGGPPTVPFAAGADVGGMVPRSSRWGSSCCCSS